MCCITSIVSLPRFKIEKEACSRWEDRGGTDVLYYLNCVPPSLQDRKGGMFYVLSCLER